MQQDNDLKHTSKSTSEWLNENKIKVLESPSHSLDLNPIEMQWHDLKQLFHARKPSSVAELKQFCKEEWAKIPTQLCERLITSYRKHLITLSRRARQVWKAFFFINKSNYYCKLHIVFTRVIFV